VDEIEKLVAEGIYLSKADFVRSAVREKLRPVVQAGSEASAGSEK
jgi:Arc/MetJ-type ribon-helix-helix transcriptional regulator